jgi:plasmid stability protein
MAIIHYELPDNLHRALKIRAAQESITLKALIIRYLELGLSGELVERELTE